MSAVSRTPNACAIDCVESRLVFRVRRSLRPASSRVSRMRQFRTSACHRNLSLDRISSSIFLVSGLLPQDRMIARIAQKQGGHTQHKLREFPLLIMFLRGMGGPQSNSHVTRVSSSLATLVQSWDGVLVSCAGHCVPASMSSVAESS